MDRGTRASETSPRAPTEGWSPAKNAGSVPQSTTEPIDPRAWIRRPPRHATRRGSQQMGPCLVFLGRATDQVSDRFEPLSHQLIPSARRLNKGPVFRNAPSVPSNGGCGESGTEATLPGGEMPACGPSKQDLLGGGRHSPPAPRSGVSRFSAEHFLDRIWGKSGTHG